MKMITPANGVVIDVPEASVEHFKAHGYKPAKANTVEGEKAPEKPKPRKKG